MIVVMQLSEESLSVRFPIGIPIGILIGIPIGIIPCRCSSRLPSPWPCTTWKSHLEKALPKLSRYLRYFLTVFDNF